MQEGSAQPCGCDPGANHQCTRHSIENEPGTYYDDRKKVVAGYVYSGQHKPATTGYVHVDDHGAITPTVAMTTTATAAPKDHSPVVNDIPFPPAAWTLSGYYDVKPAFTVKDSGARQEFASGMVRDTAEGKIDYTSVLDGPMLVRWAEHLTKAKQKYPDVAPGVANWTLAEGNEELDRFHKSAFRHFIQWMRGDVDEDHAAAVFFNINGAEFVKGQR